ncbi:MAG: hypothetical protein DDT19_02542 [Syntrophomonadaceae bacterium]|nr:hypothetical protein [Bacillota bacterium]
MKIVKRVRQYRRDFEAIMECEECGTTEMISGYDDRDFHDHVIPNMKCPAPACGKSRKDLGIESPPTQTKYAEGEQV